MVHRIDASGAGRLDPPVLAFDDPAVQFGTAGLFETLRVERGKPHLFGLHMDRLEASARRWKLHLPCDRSRLLEICALESDAPGCSEICRLRITAGPEPGAPSDGSAPAPARVFVAARPVGAEYRLPIPRRRGFRLTHFPDLSISSSHPWTGHKSSQYWTYWEARRRAEAAGFDDALLLNERGEVAETGSFNLFAVFEGRLWSPPLESGPLPGIFASWLGRLARSLGVDPARSEPMGPEALRQAEALFITNSIAEMIAVTDLIGTKMPALMEHPITAKLAEAAELHRADRAASG